MMNYIYLGIIGVLVTCLVGVLMIDFVVPTVYTSEERMSPQDRISEDQIFVYDNRVVLDIENPSWASFADTNSMDPFIDAGANSIEIKPSDPSDIKVGDVISYYSNDDIIVHRVILVGEDDQGTFYTVKGDNNTIPDPVKVRFDQVHGVLVAVIY